MENQIKDYKNAIVSIEWFEETILPCLEKNGELNKHNYRKIILNWEKLRKEALISNENLKNRAKLLKMFIEELAILKRHIVVLFRCVNKYSESNRTRINILEGRVSDKLISIAKYSENIKFTSIEGSDQLALRMQDYCLLMYDDSLDVIKDALAIDVFKSPLKIEFENARGTLKNAIDQDRIKFYLNNIGGNEEKQHQETQLETNLHPQIFRGNAFKVWQSMFDSLDVKDKSRTDVKFMFDIMKRDNLIHDTVREVDFLNWLNVTYEITVQKISYADLKNTKRLAIYNNAKELYNK